jgi:hypothetical protein
MTELEKLALHRIVQMSHEVDRMLTDVSLKIHGEKPLKAETDVYPISSKVRDMGQWASSILNNKSKS